MQPREPVSEQNSAPAVSPGLAQEIVRELQALPPQYVVEVRHFIDFLRHRHEETETSLAHDYMMASAPSLRQVWDNDADDIYEKLYRK